MLSRESRAEPLGGRAHALVPVDEPCHGERHVAERDADDRDAAAVDAARRAANLTSQLLAFGRKQMTRPTIIDLNEVLQEIRGMLDRGYINPLPTINVVSENDACTVLEGDLAFGMLVARKGMGLSIERAREHGVGMTISRNMTHTGLVGYYTMWAASQGFIGIAMNNGPVIAVIGIVPYIALQLKAVSTSFNVLRQYDQASAAERVAEARYASALAREIGLSRTPVRHAIRQLQSEGAIEQVPGRGIGQRRPYRLDLCSMSQLPSGRCGTLSGESAQRARRKAAHGARL